MIENIYKDKKKLKVSLKNNKIKITKKEREEK